MVLWLAFIFISLRDGIFEMRIFCKHKSEKVVDEILKSPFEIIVDKGHEFTAGSRPPEWMLRQRHVLIMVCSECGKVYSR